MLGKWGYFEILKFDYEYVKLDCGVVDCLVIHFDTYLLICKITNNFSNPIENNSYSFMLNI